MNDKAFRIFVVRSILFILKHATLGRASCGQIAQLEREADDMLAQVSR